MNHVGSMHNHDRIISEAAEAEGIRRGVEMAAAFLDAIGKGEAADELRAATIADQREHQEPAA